MGNRPPEKQSESNDPYVVQTEGYRVWLTGDSVIDNSYWNGVERDSTGEVLRRILPERVEVKDRSAEELDALTMLRTCREGGRFRVGSHYVQHRASIGIPYDPPDGSIDVNPDGLGPKDFFVLSVGGNDFALRGETDPAAILGIVRDLVRHYIDRGVKPEHFFYVSPYPPTAMMIAFTFVAMRKNLNSLYSDFLNKADALCKEEGITHIPISHFTRKERADPGTLIPEPTRKGARDLAMLIQNAVLAQIKQEEQTIK